MNMMNRLAHSRNLFLGLAGFLVMQANDCPSAEPANPTPAGVVGWIHVEPRGEDGRQTLALSGWALAMSPMSGVYVLAVRKQGKGGSSNTSQSGRFTAASDSPVKLSQTAVNITPADFIEIDLRISVDGREVFRASMTSAGLPFP